MTCEKQTNAANTQSDSYCETKLLYYNSYDDFVVRGIGQ